MKLSLPFADNITIEVIATTRTIIIWMVPIMKPSVLWAKKELEKIFKK